MWFLSLTYLWPRSRTAETKDKCKEKWHNEMRRCCDFTAASAGCTVISRCRAPTPGRRRGNDWLTETRRDIIMSAKCKVDKCLETKVTDKNLFSVFTLSPTDHHNCSLDKTNTAEVRSTLHFLSHTTIWCPWVKLSLWPQGVAAAAFSMQHKSVHYCLSVRNTSTHILRADWFGSHVSWSKISFLGTTYTGTRVVVKWVEATLRSHFLHFRWFFNRNFMLFVPWNKEKVNYHKNLIMLRAFGGFLRRN